MGCAEGASLVLSAGLTVRIFVVVVRRVARVCDWSGVLTEVFVGSCLLARLRPWFCVARLMVVLFMVVFVATFHRK